MVLINVISRLPARIPGDRMFAPVIRNMRGMDSNVLVST